MLITLQENNITKIFIERDGKRIFGKCSGKMGEKVLVLLENWNDSELEYALECNEIWDTQKVVYLPQIFRNGIYEPDTSARLLNLRFRTMITMEIEEFKL